MRNVIEQDFKNAIKEIEFFIILKAKELQARGWTFFLSNDAPESFKDLKERSQAMIIPISKEGCDKTIYSAPRINHLFRFWHDVHHIELDSGFSLEGEMKVIKQHLKEAKEFGLSELALDILRADTEGQVKYYYHHKSFIDNQLAFVQSCIQHGIRTAVAYKH